MLQVPQLRGGLTMFVSSYLLMAGTFFVLPLYLQLVIGDNTLETGIKLLPVSVAMMIAAVAGSRAADRVSPKRIVRIGLLLLFVGLIGTMATIDPDLSGAALAISLAFFGGGVGLIVSQLGNVVMSSVGEDKASEAGGLQGAAQSLGSSLGTALIGADPPRRARRQGFTTPSAPTRRSLRTCRRRSSRGTEQGVPDGLVSETAEQLATDAGLAPGSGRRPSSTTTRTSRSMRSSGRSSELRSSRSSRSGSPAICLARRLARPGLDRIRGAVSRQLFP